MQKILRKFFKLSLLLLILNIFSVCLQSLNLKIEIVKADLSSEWLGDWQYRKSHVINPSLGAGTNYQIRIKAYYGNGVDSGENVYLNGKCRSDFGDIRFTSLIPLVNHYRIAVPSAIHESYGLGYPVTYIFDIPSGSSNLKAYKRTGTSWQQLIEKTSSDFFNGIECVRFDYISNKAYVSVAFSEDSDYIDIKITDQNDNTVQIAYQGIAQYYDNRKAVVVATGDDWEDNSIRNEKFIQACNAFQSRQVWLTVDVVTVSYEGGSPPNWSAIQQQLDEGYIEVASHSRTHPYCPYSDYDSEIGGSKNDITGNLSLASPYKKGANEYVWAWIEPYGHSDSTVRQKLGQYKYLISRATDQGVTYFATWDNANGLYNRVGVTKEVYSTTPVSELNSVFDNAYAIGGIYHFYFHPYDFGWTGENVITQHLDHIKGKKDVWYVGFGALYAYHYVQERGQVTITPIYSSEGEQQLLDYWIEEKFDGNYAVFWVEVKNDLSTNPATIYIYYGKSDAMTTSNGDATFLFFDDFDDNGFDTTKWDAPGTGTIAEANQELTVTAPFTKQKAARQKTTNVLLGTGIEVFGRYYKSKGNEVWWTVGKVGTESNTGGWQLSFGGFDTAIRVGYSENTFYVMKLVGGIPTTITSFPRTAPGSYVRSRHQVFPSTEKFYEEDTLVGSWKHNIFSQSDYVKVGISCDDGSQKRAEIAVRKLVDPEPSHSLWGSEETFSDYVVIDQSFVTNERVDVGSIQTVGFHAKWFKNGSDVVQGSIYVNGIEYTTNGTGWISFTVTSSLVGKQEWTVTSVNCSGVTTYLQTTPNPTIIWDQIKITNGGITKESAMLGETITIWFQAQYDYDNKTFDDTSGILYVNDAQMMWSSTNSRWEYQYTLATPGVKTFTVSDVLDNFYGLSAINDTVGSKHINVWSLPFSIISNSTITEITFNSTSKTITFTVNGPENTIGYTNVTIIKTLIQDINDLQVYLDNSLINYTDASTEYYWLIHFTYHHSTHKVLIKLGTTNRSQANLYLLEKIIALNITMILIAVSTLSVRRKARRH